MPFPPGTTEQGASRLRVWDTVDPRLLSRRHLLGEHQELHSLLSVLRGESKSNGWRNHPEAKRFEGNEHLVIVRHNLVVMAMNLRWPGRHTFEAHPTPMTGDARGVAELMGWVDTIESYRHICDAGVSIPKSFEIVHEIMHWPETQLEHSTPWDRDRMTMSQYIELGDDWTSEYKEGNRPLNDPHRVPILEEPSQWALGELQQKGVEWTSRR